MAITAAIRTTIIELNVLAGNGAPGTTGLGLLVTEYDKTGITGVATSITSTAGWVAKFPTFQTPDEFGKEFLEMIVPGLSATVMTEGQAIITGLLNSGSTQADILSVSSTFLSNASVTDAAFGDYAAKFQNQAAVAEFHTVTQEKDTPLSLADITSDAATVVTAKADIDGSAVVAAAAAATAAAAAAAVTAAAADTAAATAADAAAATALAGAATATATTATAKTASDAAATKAALTDAVALAATSAAALVADTAAIAAATAAATAYTAALNATPAVPATVVTKNGEKLIADNTATVTAAALVAAETATDAAVADDAAAAAAATALATATTASDAAVIAANTATTAAAAAATTAGTVVSAAVATAAATNDAAAAATAAATAVTAAETATVAAATAVAAITSTATASAALVAANAAVTAAEAATTATATYTAAVAATPVTTDDAGAVTSAASAVSNVAAAAALVTAATAEVGIDRTASALTLSIAAETLNGGSGDDTFAAVVAVTGVATTGSTLMAGDILNGGLGNDTLTISTSGAPTGAAVPYVIAAIQSNNIENVLFNAYDTENTADGTALDLSLFTGLKTVGTVSASASGDLHFTNAKNLVDIQAYNTAGNIKVTYPSGIVSVLLGDQTQNIALQNVQSTSVITVTAAAGGVETVNLSSTVLKSTLSDLVIDAAKTLNITGDKNLTISSAVDFINNTTGVAGAIDGVVNASAFTGKLSFTAASDEMDIRGGTGNDTINMVGTLNGYDKIDGGAGADTLTMNAGALSTQFAQISNVETLKFNASSGAQAFNLSKLPASVTTVISNNKDGTDDTNSETVTFSNHTTQLIGISHTVADAGVDGNGDGMNVTITGATDTAADSVSVKLLSTGGISGATGGKGTATLDVASYETLNLESDGTVGGVTTNTINALTATKASTVNITGDATLTVTAATLPSSATGAVTVDASGLAAKLVMTSPNITGVYSLGQKSSTLNMGSGLTNADKITGGAGTADTVTATLSTRTATTGKFDITAVEKLVATTGAANTIDLSGVTGLTNLTVTDAKQTIKGLDLSTTVQLGTAADASATASEIDVTAADATGAADTLKVAVDATIAPTSIIDASAIETLALTIGRAATGTAATTTLDVSTFEGSTITLANGALTAGAVVTPGAVTLTSGVKVLNAATTTVTSTVKQAVTASFANAVTAATFTGKGTGVQDVTGGLRGDTFNIGSTGNITHVLSGGAGVDTLNITTAAGFIDAGDINVENINITVPAAVDIAINGSQEFHAGVDNITLTGGNSLSTFAAASLVTGIKTLDASGFQGNITADFAANLHDGTVTVTGGPLATDNVTAIYDTVGGTFKPLMVGVETLTVDSNSNVTVDVSGSTGLKLVTMDLVTAKTQTVSNLPSTLPVQVTVAAATNAVLQLTPEDATAADNSVAIKLKSATAGGIADDFAIKTDNIETVNLTVSTTAESIDLSNLAMTTAGARMTLNVLADATYKGLTASATGADVTTISAAGGYGFTQGVPNALTLIHPVAARSATTAVNYTGSAGNDTFIMKLAADNIAGGAGTGDTLVVDYDAVLNGISIDLSSAGQQILSMDGGAITGAVSGFENVGLADFTGGSAVVTAIKTGSIVTLSGQTDRFTGGAGNDTVQVVTATSADVDVVVGGGGSDTIKIADGLAGTTTAQNIVDLTTPGNSLFANTGVLALFSGFENIDVSLEAEATKGFTLKGTTGANVIKGSAGDDILTFTGGNDTVTLGGAVDTINVTTALLAGNSGTTATIAGDAGVDIMTISDAGTTVVDADFRGLTTIETLKIANGTNTVVLGSLAKAAGIVNVTGGTGVDTVTLHDTVVAYGVTAGADVITFDAAYAGGLTMTDGVTATDDQVLDFSAFQDAATSWGTAETNATDVDAADEWHAASNVLTIYNENKTGGAAAVTITTANMATGIGFIDALAVNGQLTLDVA